jgi:hypothetical protein
MLSSREERGSLERRQKRYARYREVMELHRQGISERAIARALSINRATLRKFIGAGTRSPSAPHIRELAASSSPIFLTSTAVGQKGAKTPYSCGAR